MTGKKRIRKTTGMELLDFYCAPFIGNFIWEDVKCVVLKESSALTVRFYAREIVSSKAVYTKLVAQITEGVLTEKWMLEKQ